MLGRKSTFIIPKGPQAQIKAQKVKARTEPRLYVFEAHVSEASEAHVSEASETLVSEDFETHVSEASEALVSEAPTSEILEFRDQRIQIHPNMILSST
jgi:hypothetical protein